MCTIAGILSTTNNQQLLDNILNSQRHRGPDYQDSVTIATESIQVQLGHNRLSIIDLSESGSQPMWDREKQYCLTFNGEIYNYIELRQELLKLGIQFSSQSDTEVLLYAFKVWGQDALSRINGMFAFAIFDRKKNKLYLYRDRYGQKPLYYYAADGLFCFSSESQALVDHFQLKPDPEKLTQGLAYWLYEDGSENTVFKGLKQLPAASMLQINLDHKSLPYTVQRYYDISQAISHDRVDSLINHLERSVTYRLRSDVPVGISLSGGLDSSAIAAIGAKHNVTAFSFSDPHDKKSEGPLVNLLSKKLNIPVHYISFEKENLVESFWQTLKSQGAPFPGMSVVAQNLVYKKVKQQGVKVLLGGQGGDEAFLGYRKFLLLHLKKNYRDKNMIASLLWSFYLLPIFLSELPRWRGYYQRFKMYGASQKSPLKWDLSQSLQQRQIIDLMALSLPSLLRYEDRNSMAHSIESRMPFLDYQLMEYAVSLPVTQKLHQGYGKWALREAMKERLPKDICFARYKRGFDVPEKRWILAGLGESMRAVIKENRSSIEDFIGQKIPTGHILSDKNLANKKSDLNFAILLSWLAKQL